jgi:hypothetical protein
MYFMSVGTEDNIYQLCRVSGYLIVLMIVTTNNL